MSNPLDFIGNVTPSTRAIAKEVNNYLDKRSTPLPTYPEKGSGVIWGYSPGAEHGTRRALDFMTRSASHIGDAIADYLWAHRKRLGLVHIIWRQRIKSTVVSPGEWRPMADRGSSTNNHMDHVHALFNGQAITVPVYVDRNAHPVMRLGSKGESVKHAQKMLRASLVIDGDYGPKTITAVRRFQNVHRLTVDGVTGPKTWAALHANSKDGK